MKLTVTVAIARAAYAYLAETPPFNTWNLPNEEDVIFTIKRGKDFYGRCSRIDKKIAIEISSGLHGTTDTLMRTMAHEMIHVFEFHHKLKKTSEHGRGFQRLAQSVCETHGFDPKNF
jgi:predicted SprT family Zn-dependent metalloprotease